MSTLGSCETWVSRSIKRFFQLLLKDAFITRFGYNGPRHTLLFRDLAFLPHVIQTDLPWRRIRLELVRSFLDIDSRRWGHCLHAPHSLDRSSARLVDIEMLSLITASAYSKLSLPDEGFVFMEPGHWHAPKQPKRDVRMRKCKRLRAKGPICLQETKWSASEKEVLLQHIPGLQIAEFPCYPHTRWSLVRGCCCTCASWLCIKGLERLLPSLLTEPANITLCPSISTLIEFDRI